MNKVIGHMSNFENERKQFACMIAYELGAMNETDSIYAMAKCVEYAQRHEFELEENSKEVLIDTESARLKACEYAKLIAEEYSAKYPR